MTKEYYAVIYDNHLNKYQDEGITSRRGVIDFADFKVEIFNEESEGYGFERTFNTVDEATNFLKEYGYDVIEVTENEINKFNDIINSSKWKVYSGVNNYYGTTNEIENEIETIKEIRKHEQKG